MSVPSPPPGPAAPPNPLPFGRHVGGYGDKDVAQTAGVVVGVGARAGVTAAEVGALVDSALAEAGVAPDEVRYVATVEAKSAEPGIVEAVAARGWDLVAYPAGELATVDVPNPAERVGAELGTGSVAEAAALYGGAATLLVPKRRSEAATVAIARHEPSEVVAGAGGERITVVGVGAEGWRGLGEVAQEAVAGADVIVGSERQLGLIPDEIGAERVPWPSPMVPALPGLLDEYAGRRVTVLASGDPMFFGVGAVLTRVVGAANVHVVPHSSSVSLACARLGWPVQDVTVISAVGRPVELLHPAIHPGRRILVLSADGGTPATVVKLLAERGYGASAVTVLENLGASDERITAAESQHAPLSIVAIECAGTALTPTTPGLPDDTYDHDGQLTKREVRAITLARLAPIPGQLLWDVGAGAGSIAIEWARTHPSCRAVAIESDPGRAARIAANAASLGVPGIQVVTGHAPPALDGLDPPDAIFIGGGLTTAGPTPAGPTPAGSAPTGYPVLDRCWDALKPGGRLVVNAVTIESEQVVIDAHRSLGGDLTRIAIDRAAPVGGFTAWRPALPVTQWTVTK